MSKRHNILRTRTRSLFQVQEIKVKLFSSSCFIADDSHAKIVWLHVVVFTEREIFEIILIY